MKNRQVNLVNDRDEIIGHTDLFDAHRGLGKKHQAVSLFLFHQKSAGGLELLIQQRSDKKIVGAKQWANTLCANLIPGENHLTCVKRRAFEELGIRWQDSWQIEEVAVLDYQVTCENGFSENELDHFFVVVLDDRQFSSFKLKLNPDEAIDSTWLEWSLVKTKQMGQRQITPWFNLFLDREEVIQKIEEACQI